MLPRDAPEGTGHGQPLIHGMHLDKENDVVSCESFSLQPLRSDYRLKR